MQACIHLSHPGLCSKTRHRISSCSAVGHQRTCHCHLTTRQLGISLRQGTGWPCNTQIHTTARLAASARSSESTSAAEAKQATAAAAAAVSTSPPPAAPNTAAPGTAAGTEQYAAGQLADDPNTAAAAVGNQSSKQAVTERLSGCPQCEGSGRISCKECDGRGFLKRGGYNKKNPLNMNRITGSKWTAMQQTLGWRHFRVIQQRKLDKHSVFLLLQASCDHSAQIWVNAQVLRDRKAWAAGWLQMSEIQGLGAEIQGSGLKCQSCSGLGFKACQACDGTGHAQLIVL